MDGPWPVGTAWWDLCHEELRPMSLSGVSCHIGTRWELTLCSGDRLQPCGRDSCYLAVGWKVSGNGTRDASH